ncbi:MAG: PilZ domain-containing protein [Thermoanaerobaculia bacterium]|nr:PilZ domain-containing protein [Thermoanaerobaculia bacterium]
MEPHSPPPEDPRPRGERRRETRFRAERLSGSLEFDHDVAILDVSSGGLALEGAHRMIPGRRYRIRLPLPEARLDVSGRVVWCHLLGTRRVDDDVVPVYRAGLRLDEELGPAALEQLAAAKATPSGAGTRLQARFKTSELASALLGGSAPFRVESLSRFGMSVRMEFAPHLRSVLELVLDMDAEPVEIRARVVGVTERGPERADDVEGDADADGTVLGPYVVGLEFTGLSPEAERSLRDYLSALHEASADAG